MNKTRYCNEIKLYNYIQLPSRKVLHCTIILRVIFLSRTICLQEVNLTSSLSVIEESSSWYICLADG